MFPIGKVFEFIIADAPGATYSADGAVAPRSEFVTLDGSATTAQMTLAAPSAANGMDGKLIIFRASDVSNTVDVDYTAQTGAVTWTPANAGEMLILIGSGTVWFKIA